MRKTNDYRRLQRRCQALLDGLQAPQSRSFEAICQWMEELQGRPLILGELPPEAATSGVCGLWLGTDDANYVFYEAQTARPHQEHIVLHELGHILCGHYQGEGVTDDLASGLFSGLDPQMIKRHMARTSYTTSEEQEAEMIASLLHGTGRPGRPGGALGRLGAFLGVSSSHDGE
ncbi:regulator component [Streptomyces sp. H27-C3]|uniref:regulator component n=1 Tax=Streptomyces sp. H27-C3 TaxID=3046305 RepID=UPI0024BB3E7A|nr:regulator component [Streptomyces sp. H27-C3]MDJ0466764.1 regulator component [Streptomyces sp. H27-C3]